MKSYFSVLTVFLSLAASAFAQESVRKLERPGDFNKFLTPGTIDRWIIQGEEGETIIARVTTKEFDPVIELAEAGDPEDKVLLSFDDDGSESWFSYRLPKAGEYKIRIHGFEFKGGGNYALNLRRFRATPVEFGKPLVGAFDRHGRSHHYLHGEHDQMLTVGGTGLRSWEMLDTKGRPVGNWRGSVRLEQDGEYSLALTGQPGTRYELRLRPAERKQAAFNAEMAGRLNDGELAVFDIAGKAGAFRLVEIQRQGELAARLIHAPLEEDKRPRIASADQRPAIQALRTADKGQVQRFAVLLGRDDRYQLQVVAQAGGSYKAKVSDPTMPLEVGQTSARALPVGAAEYYRFQGSPGQLVIAELASDQFDPFLRLYDEYGKLVAENDDGAGGLGSRISHIVMKEQAFHLQVSSLGNGGGGKYEFSLAERKAKPLVLDKRSPGKLEDGGTDHWSFEGKAGASVFFHARSADFDPDVSLRGPDGVLLGQDDNGGVGTDSLLAVKLPKSGRYTVWVTTRSGSGEYWIRPIPGD